MSDRKRAHPIDSKDGDTPTKKARLGEQTASAGGANGGGTSASNLAAMRAKVAAKFATFQSGGPSAGGGSSQPSSSSIQSKNTPSVGSASGGSSNAAEMARKIAETKRRVQEGMAKQKAAASANPYLGGGQGGSQSLAAARAKALADQANNAKPGTGIHPALLDNTPSAPSSSKDRYKPMAPKFSSTSANARAYQSMQAGKKPQQLDLQARGPTLEEARQDPHFDRRLGVESLQPRQKRSRPMLQFNQKGKFVRMAESVRQEQKMEALKARIAEAARKTGMEEDLEADGGLGRRIKKQPPPEVEWWDVAFVENETYDSLDTPQAKQLIDHGCSDLIQHPIPIPAPSDKKDVSARPAMLTKKERKKMRRIKRAEQLRDHQDRVKMGLLPPDPPKVKLSNMMRVLTQEAVADPTKIEARVRREMNARQAGHDKMNAQRKLTKDERREKIENKARSDEAKGLHAAVFRIKHLKHPLHIDKVCKNAEQLYCTGVCLFTPRFGMVLVEGSAKAIKKYKRLMLHRIDWTEEQLAYAPVGDVDDDDAGGDKAAPVNMAENECVMVWEGELRDRLFNNFRRKTVPTDHMAREFLGPRTEGYFDLARKSMGLEIGM